MTDTKLVFRDEPIQQSSSKIIQWFGLDQFEPERALTSHFVSSKSLFWIRLPLVLYSFIVMWVDIIYTAETGGFRQFFAYFTDLTFIGMHAYLMTPAVFWLLLAKEKLFEGNLHQRLVSEYTISPN
ncbi:unnamed protein product [Mucor fragilis]